MPKTKKCPYCRSDIDKKAKICPHCQKKQFGLGSLFSALIVILFLIIFIPLIAESCSSSSDSDEEPERSFEVVTTEAQKEKESTTKKAKTEKNETTEPKTEAEAQKERETVIETTEQTAMGKNVDELYMFQYYGEVRNDVTGKWRYAVCADSGKIIAEYALTYYNKYMSDGEIHAIINFSDRTTTKLVQAIEPEKIALTVYEYVDGEEHDAKLMFSGKVLAYYMVNKNTGEITEE